jgi:hypothetical protein
MDKGWKCGFCCRVEGGGMHSDFPRQLLAFGLVDGG